MKIVSLKDYQAVSAYVATMIIEQIHAQPQSVLGLATGSTPEGVYALLTDAYRQGEISFAQVRTFNLDEYVGLDHHHPQSYHAYMEKHLFQAVDLDPKRCHLPENHGDLNHHCAQYTQQLRAHRVDLQILAIGRNGHIGFNEPGTPFASLTHVVTLDDATIADNARFFSGDTAVPHQAITMGIQNILESKRIVLMATGATKCSAIDQLLHGPVNEQLPASALRNHPDVTVVIDAEIASCVLKQTPHS